MSQFTSAWFNEQQNRPRRKLRHSQPEPDQAPALGGAVQGKTDGVPAFTVRFIGCRVTPLDPDNFAGSVKDLLDGLRHAGLIPGDDPTQIKLETSQVRVATLSEEKTIVEIEQP